MPELPEVEITRRHLEAAVVGMRIERVEVRRQRMVRRQHRPADFRGRLRGRTVSALGRLGKFILADLDGDLHWVTHLGMSGRIQLATGRDPEDKHTNVLVGFDDGTEVRFVDPRTFGFMAVFTTEELEESSIARLGRDALNDLPTARELGRALERRSAPIKALLLDQRLMAGLGNIYADEVLHRASIDPTRSGGSLTATEVSSLRAVIRPVLRAGLRAGGTSLEDMAYLLPDGRAGRFLSQLAVYGRAGDTCGRCGDVIVREVIRGRGTHWCRGCQL